MDSKKLIRLTESDLNRIVKETVSSILKEDYYSNTTDVQQTQGQQGPQTQQQPKQEQQEVMGRWNALAKWCTDMARTSAQWHKETMQALNHLREMSDDTRMRLARLNKGY